MASTAIVLPPEEERLETVALFILLRLEVVSVAGKMTPKMQKFVDEYLVDLNATQAAIRAGYSKKTAYSIGVSNLKKPEIQAAIQKRQKSAAEKLEITRERVLKELASIGFAKATDFLTIQGGRVLIKDSDDVAADKLAALASVKEGMYGVEVKLADKLALSRCLANISVSLTGRIRRAIRRRITSLRRSPVPQRGESI